MPATPPGRSEQDDQSDDQGPTTQSSKERQHQTGDEHIRGARQDLDEGIAATDTGPVLLKAVLHPLSPAEMKRNCGAQGGGMRCSFEGCNLSSIWCRLCNLHGVSPVTSPGLGIRA
ncbi:hypothetical protein ON010_g18037 [Phytophthora cinnamomi]|nr:hypothetical protein ON010_g18037 [Phytophthora cinnamomi]